ncbi:MAG TPA: DUF481 domain-containing protein [Cellvibrio sp.]|nr:DUF481 domain-containing protein [Cellvibrio sp.]
MWYKGSLGSANNIRHFPTRGHMFTKAKFFTTIALLGLADTLAADVVYTSNGDKFVGHIIELDGQLLKIDTPVAGMLTIETKWITSFTTDQAANWEIQDVPTETKIETATENGYVTANQQALPITSLRLKSRALPDKISGNIEAGWDVERDNDRKRELRLKAELHYQFNQWRHEGNAEIKQGELQGIANEDVLEINYTPDYLINSHWLVTVDTSYREEGIDTVSTYSHAGIGPGYRFWGDAKDQLDFTLSGDKIWIKSGSINLQMNAIAAGIDYQQFFLNERLESYIDYRITYPDWSGIDYIVNSTLGLRYSFTHYVYLSVKYDINKTRYLLGTLQDRETNFVLGVKF